MESSNATLPYLTEDLLVEILLRLAIKSLVRFSCVCKPWKNLITSDYFRRSHLQISSSATKQTRNVVLLRPVELYPNIDRLQNPEPQGMRFARELAHALADSQSGRLILPKDSFKLAGCCDGIVCFYVICNNSFWWDLYKSDLTIYLCNPSLNQFRVLPRNNCQPNRRDYVKIFTSVYFVFDPVNVDYEVIVITNCAHASFLVEIYTLSNNSWRGFTWDIPVPSSMNLTSGSVVHNGFLYWFTSRLTDDINDLNEFDISNEKIRQIPLPDCFSNVLFPDLRRHQGSLYVSSWWLDGWWVMKEDYNEDTFWVKEHCVPYFPCVCGQSFPTRRCCSQCLRRAVHLRENPGAKTTWTYLIAHQGKIFFCDEDNGRMDEYATRNQEAFEGFEGVKYVVADYVASLVSVMPPRTPIPRNEEDGRELKDEREQREESNCSSHLRFLSRMLNYFLGKR